MALSKKNSKVTMASIAKLAKCSKNTVSLALQDSPRISKHTKKKVYDIAKKLNFVPNYAARNLSKNRSGLIGLYTHALEVPANVELVTKFIKELNTTDHRPILGLSMTQQELWDASPWISTFKELNIDGLVLLNEDVITVSNVPIKAPIIAIACPYEPQLECDYVSLDRREAGRLAVTHLLTKGHRDILISDYVLGAHFVQGCINTLAEHGLKPHFFKKGITCDTLDIQELIAHLKHNKKITAVIFYDSNTAFKFINHAVKSGLRIPDDVAVVAYDYYPNVDLSAIPFTTIEQPIAEISRKGVEIVRNRIKNPSSPLVKEVVPHILVPRQST